MLPAELVHANVSVVRSKEETPSVRSIRVSKPEGFSFHASQAVRLTLRGQNGAVARPFSIASGPTRPYLEFAARRSDSDFKRAFFALRPGDQAGVLGPRGHFLFDHSVPGVLVAAGIGITPLKSMLEHASDAALPSRVTLIYGNRHPDEIAFRGDLDAMARTNPNIEIVHTVTTSAEGWTGRVGRIDASLLREVSPGLDAIYYLAGPPKMVEESYRALLSLGVSEHRIRYEVFGGYGGLAE